MDYKKLPFADLTSPDLYLNLAEIYLNGQKGLYFMKANALEGWVETYITIDIKMNVLKFKNNYPMLIRIYGNVEIYALDKKGNKIQQ
jgi:hypothetical protein